MVITPKDSEGFRRINSFLARKSSGKMFFEVNVVWNIRIIMTYDECKSLLLAFRYGTSYDSISFSSQLQ
ncbi:hypothetical protein Y032_0256g366 [Ancylostoma ceylanicum]|uniref:Uncharacterized protein n=1 Tax=Ancylostoma ceylanicum TaxID=53326 RepID=A0A016SB23_9BILA|nr:hypothetical protein Y032_0256g366 [Ancylostoma ceylanicum]